MKNAEIERTISLDKDVSAVMSELPFKSEDMALAAVKGYSSKIVHAPKWLSRGIETGGRDSVKFRLSMRQSEWEELQSAADKACVSLSKALNICMLHMFKDYEIIVRIPANT